MSDVLPDPSTNRDLPAIAGGTPLRPQGPPEWPVDAGEIAEVLAKLAASGDWGRYHASHTRELRKRLAEFVGVEHVLLCSSGTAAVEFALRGVGVEPGDEVILAAYDFKANLMDVLAIGAVPVLADIRPEDAQLDIDLLASLRTERTRAVLASHLHGGLVEMSRLRDWAHSEEIAVVEDACQAIGARIAGRPAGAWGDVAAFSFGGSKLVTAGRGGAVVTSDAKIAQRIRLFTHRGNDYAPLSEMQAAILVPQLERLPERHRQRRSAVSRLCDQLQSRRDLPLRPLTTAASDHDAAFYKLGFWFDPQAMCGMSREQFCEAIRAEGFALDPAFPSLHETHARSRYSAPRPLPHATAAGRQLVVLHHPLLLRPPAEVDGFIAACDRIARWAASGGVESVVPHGG